MDPQELVERYGADVQPKMSVLPNVAGQSCCGSGVGTSSAVVAVSHPLRERFSSTRTFTRHPRTNLGFFLGRPGGRPSASDS